jgi:hypothetical protein
MNPNDPDDEEMWQRATKWFEGPDFNPRHMEPDLLEWVLTHHPKWIKMTVNQEWFTARIKELEAQGIDLTPELFSEMFPGLTMITWRCKRPKGFDRSAGASEN